MNEMVKSLARAMRGLTQWLVPNACSSLDAPVASGWRQKLTRYALRSGSIRICGVSETIDGR